MARMLRLPAVLEKTALTRARLYELIATGKFPRPFKLNPDGGRASGWLEAEVDAYIERIVERQRPRVADPISAKLHAAKKAKRQRAETASAAASVPIAGE